MNIVNFGTLYASKPLDDTAVMVVKAVFSGSHGHVNVNRDQIEFDTFNCSEANGLIDTLVDKLAPLGVQLEGRIEYYGDYEGAYLLEKGEHCEELDAAELAIRDAETQALIADLERRGYIVQAGTLK